MKKKLQLSIILLLTFTLGIVTHRYRSHLIDGQFIRNHLHFRKEILAMDKIVNSERVIIFMAFGQSNSADYGAGKYNVRNEVYNYYKGKLYAAAEPLLGPDGKGSSVWTRVADLVIDSGLYDRAIIVPCGIGQTPIKCWSSGECADKVKEILDDLNRDGIKLTHVFWCQGETDNVNGTTAAEYGSELEKVIGHFRNRGIDAPFFVSLTSYFPFNNSNPLGISEQVLQGQLSVLDSANHVLKGPNVDALNLAYYRYDAVHFSEKGLDQLAMAWYQVIKDYH